MNVVVIQARMGSTRLPGKVLLDLAGETVLSHVIKRVSLAKLVDRIVIAIPDTIDSDCLEVEVQKNNALVYRGDEKDVLARYYHAAVENKAKTVVRITSDCPLIDPWVIDSVVSEFYHQKSDYCSNVLMRTFPRGLDVEVFNFASLERAYIDAREHFEREHVTPYINRHGELFNISHHRNTENLSQYRLTLDTQEDYHLLKLIYDRLYKGVPLKVHDVLTLLRDEPMLFSINSHVEQKEVVS